MRVIGRSQTSLKEQYGFENPFIPDPLVRKAIRYCKGAKVLDVGCGEGADSVYYAKHGFAVTAIDNNRTYLKRLRSYLRDNRIPGVSVSFHDVVTYRYPRNRFDVVSCILVICCMKKSEFERMIIPLKQCVKPGGTIILSARNYLDPELREYRKSEKVIEPNTYRHKAKCRHQCTYVYFVEKNMVKKAFEDFEILYYYEGYAPCKYGEHPKHGDTYIVCRRSVSE